MNRSVLIAVIAAAVVAIGAMTFVNSRPTVPDGGGADTNIADSQPGNPDGASGANP